MSLSELYSVPIIQAPMAGSTNSELVAAVSIQGALGSLGAAMMSPSQLKHEIKAIKEKTTQPFAVNCNVSARLQKHYFYLPKKCNDVNLQYFTFS